MEQLTQIPDWTIVEGKWYERAKRVFTFNNFANALVFTNKVGALAQSER